jgi:TetR/AcrR family transcriptional regulator, transcriptional repressor for nem operon
MRYELEHKAKTHKKIVEDAARRFRAEGLGGAGVASVMRDTGLTHGGFYKHFRRKSDLLVESIGEAFHETADWLVQIAAQAPPPTAWKAVVKAYLSPEHCNHPEKGCPVAALASELGRSDPSLKGRISADMVNYKDRIVPFLPGRRAVDRERAFFLIFSTMIGAIEMARMMPDGVARERILTTTRDFLFDAFSSVGDA